MSNEHTPAISPMLVADDVPKTLAFYRDVLGFTLTGAWPNEEAPAWASLELNGQTVMLGGKAQEGDPMCEGAEGAFFVALTDDLEKAPGGGVLIYLTVPDVDAYYAEISSRGAQPVAPPKDQFYGIRDFQVRDLDGYRFSFCQPIRMSSCQSCGMPLTDAKEGQMYCGHCVDAAGQLKPYEEVLEGTVVGYFMGMQQLERPAAEAAARELLAKMPAWASHQG